MLHQSSPLLACMVTLFLNGKSKVFSGRRYSQHPRLSGRNNSHFALENEDSKNVPCLFSMASSLVTYLVSTAKHARSSRKVRRNKTLEWRLATLDASSATMSHALQEVKKNLEYRVICKSASSKLSASCLQGYSVSIGKIQGFSGRRYSQHPRLSWR